MGLNKKILLRCAVYAHVFCGCETCETLDPETKVFHVLLKEQTSDKDDKYVDSDPGLYIFKDTRESDNIDLCFLKDTLGQEKLDNEFLPNLREAFKIRG